MNSRHSSKNKKSKKARHYEEKSSKNLILFIIIVLFIGLFVYSGFKIIDYFLENNENKEITEEISNSIIIDKSQETDEEDKYKIDFESLKAKNSDTAGFIKVNGTDIEYIVVKSDDNNYYLNHNFNKEKNSAGWIFADYHNKLDGSDKNVIIYGHNMKNGTMFSSLKNVLNGQWHELEENRYITFITEDENSIYEVFSVYQIENEDYYIKTDFKEGEFAKFLNTMKSRSKFYFDVDVGDEDTILTLSTCADNSKDRIVLHAKKIY